MGFPPVLFISGSSGPFRIAGKDLSGHMICENFIRMRRIARILISSGLGTDRERYTDELSAFLFPET